MAENDLRLLRMYKALLDSPNNNASEQDIAKYEKQVHKIDNKLYDKIISKIDDNSNFMDYPLERQLEFLLEIEKDYDDYFDFQEEVIRICKKNNIDISLCNIKLINIEVIRKRISAIKKYLENVKQIGINNDTLGSLNEQLIDLNNSEDTLKKIVDRHDESLRHKVQIVNGRVKINDRSESTSISKEATDLGLDLDKLLNDKKLLEDELSKVNIESSEASEQLKLTVMCNTDGKYEDLYLNAFNDDVMKKYKLIFLKIISLISSNDYSGSYDKAKEKRLELIELIKTRIKLLKDINIIYLFDPFNNLEIDKQLESIEPYSNISVRIREIVDRISVITADNDRMTSENNDYLDLFREKVELKNDETSLSDIALINVDISNKKYPDSRVMSVISVPASFVLERAIGKAKGVVNRVSELMKHPVKNNSSSITPNLVIEQKTVNDNSSDFTFEDDIFLEETSEEPEKEDDMFLDLPSELGIDNNDVAVFDDNKFDVVSSNIETDNDSEELFADYPMSSGSDEELFSELSPFDDSAKLFEERTDNGITEDKTFEVDFTPTVTPNPFLEHVENNNSDMFWTTKTDADNTSNVEVDNPV